VVCTTDVGIFNQLGSARPELLLLGLGDKEGRVRRGIE
jgi:hypothetical protein